HSRGGADRACHGPALRKRQKRGLRRRHYQAVSAARSHRGNPESDRRRAAEEEDHRVSKKRRKGRRVAKSAPAVPPAAPARWNPDPEDVQRSVVKLVLSLIEFIRKLMERQAIRRL